ncbi:MSEP-CTERM sorting domain-containing protein [Kordia algicida OT-1]|uniref:VIT domain-containing protein n=1 Tax=Kordia algicida OT-1 TaxID=391587 RepID=A9E3F6_9FLAO|nr:MSEP-CTERM sorting domain-containing protein [Kordia algicida]EDP95504.1 hypothetical protein KAOT1_11291 [Kordia algicida OT-1]
MLPFKLHKTYAYFVSLILLQLILGWLFYTAFDTPKGNTFPATGFTLFWGFLLLLFTVLIFFEVAKKIKPWLLPLAIIICYSIFLMQLYESDIFHQIPRIKASSINFEIIPLYLTIPGIFHAMLDLIFKQFRPSGKLRENGQNFAFAATIPIGIYTIAIIIIPLFSRGNGSFLHLNMFIMKIAICIAIASFLFFFLRFILGNIVGRNLNAKNPIMVVLFGAIFPFIGLALNAEFKIFGNFNFIAIYIALILNAIGLILLLQDAVLSKFIGFLGASAGFPVVLYFFIIFLPYIPLSFIALIVLGAGILMLTPIVLLILQYKIMSREFVTITKTYGKKKLLLCSFACLLLLPISFFGFCMDHKNYFNDVIAETDFYDASNTNYVDYDTEKIVYILKEMNKGNRRLSLGNAENRLPILSIFYDWYVFDNLQVSQRKIADIQRLFLGKIRSSWNRYVPPQRLNAEVKYKHYTEYDAKNDFYKTEVHLAITNLDSVGMREFRSEFTLPKDVFITDYYLDIEDRRTFGILAEKKAANWIYEQITTQRRDPGILQYLYGDVLSLKIFPFKKNETRTSGFTLYHRTPVHFTINETPIDIDVQPLAQHVTELSANTFYVPSAVKKTLPKKQIPVNYYLVVDNTTKGEKFREQFEEDFSSLSPEIQEKAQVLYVDADVNWGTPTAPKACGFNYKKVISQILYKHRNQESIPFVVVYAPYENRFQGKFSTWEMEQAFPYYNLIEHSHWDKKIPSFMELVEFSQNGASSFLHNNAQPSLVSFDDTATLDRNISGNPYLNALQLRLFHDLNDLNPKRKKEHWLNALRESFKQNILTHSTTFISLETTAQEERLLQKQKEIMNADYTEKAGSETRRMSEPYFWVLLLVFAFIIRKQFLLKQAKKV